MAISVDIEKKLHGFTLKVKLESDGSPMGILGASGSGKSMTLRCIAGIQTPDSGRIVVNDISASGCSKDPHWRTITQWVVVILIISFVIVAAINIVSGKGMKMGRWM